MSPRTYNLGLRLAAAEQTRGRIIDAAREILSDQEFCGLSIDAISRRAGVARMTVYYQFGSRRGLLEALYDDLAARGLMTNLQTVLDEADPRRALYDLVDVFTRFWMQERPIIRRLRGLSVIDQEVEAGLRERDRLRTGHVGKLLQAIEASDGWTSPLTIDEATRLVAALIDFDNYDHLAGEEADVETTIDLLQRALREMLCL